MMYKLGVDVGGTNTDAVLIDENLQVVADIKYPTSGDVYEGILCAVREVLRVSGIDKTKIRQAMLGTTQCTNAIVERKNLAPIGILRLGAPATMAVRPMLDWAEDIQGIAVGSKIIGGGFEHDGKELAPFDREAARAFFQEMREKGVKSMAISSVFSTVRNDQELEAAKLCREVMGPDVHVSISSEIGSMGLIERENATILNAALWQVADRFTEGFAKSLAEEGITNADIYLSQNDGTLMTMEHARRYPILTVACGPTNSIRGASYLSKLKNAIVIDVGGTTTDLGAIQNGFPPGVQRGSYHRRGAHQFPHAGCDLHWSRGRLHRAAKAGWKRYGRAGQRGLCHNQQGADLRRRYPHRYGHRSAAGHGDVGRPCPGTAYSSGLSPEGHAGHHDAGGGFH